jgi:hypothetical protein
LDNQYDILSSYNILKITPKNLTSNKYIKKINNQKNLTSELNVSRTFSGTINSNSLLVLPEYQKILTSNSVISIPNVGGLFHTEFSNALNIPEFKKKIIYRRFSLDYDNVTGDINKDSYTDYQIYSSLYIMNITFKHGHVGDLETADGEMFLPARISRDIDGDNINHEFRASIDDSIYWLGCWYRITNIEFQKIGNTEVYCICKLKKTNNTFPDFKWNKEYKVLLHNQNFGGWA